MEQNKPEYLDNSPEAANVDESRRGYYESEIKKAIGNVKREADYAALEARCAGLERERNDAILKLDYVEGLRVKWMMERTDLFQVIKDARAERDALQAKLAAAEEALRQSSIAFDLLHKAKEEDRDSFGWSWDEAWEKIEEAQTIAAALADTTTVVVQP